ncbi:MAG: type II toxin-antitoxin system RelE/ParE family toxin [Rudaea sp.]
MPIEVRKYQQRDGSRPFDDWLISLRDVVAAQRIGARIARLRTGNFGDCKSVGGGVLELRIDHGPGYRVYFGKHGQTLVLLLCGGDKRTQARDILNARNYWHDWEANKS